MPWRRCAICCCEAAMPDGLASRLPDLTSLQQTGLGLQSGIGDLINQIAGLVEQRQNSPLVAVTGMIGELKVRVTVDTGALAEEFPDALAVMRNALPDGAIDFVQSIETAYGDVQAVLRDSELMRAMGSGSLEAAALAAVKDALTAFDARRQDLLKHLIDPETLAAITSTFSTLRSLETDFAANRAQLLPFLSRNLAGIAPDLLTPARTHVDAFLTRLGPLTRDGLNAALKDARAALAAALAALTRAVNGLDPAVAAGYSAVAQALDAVDAAFQGLVSATRQLYATALEAVGALPLDALFDTLRRLIDAITIVPVLSVDEVVGSFTRVLDGILARLQALLGPDDVARRIRALNQQINTLFAQSPLGQIRTALNDFLDHIRQAIEAVPTDRVKAAVEQMLARIRDEIATLRLDRIGDTIDHAFEEIDRFVQQQVDAGVAAQVKAAIKRLLDQLQNLPIRAVADQLAQVLAQIRALLDELRSAIEAGLAEIRTVLQQLDGLSFKPVSDAVIGEIDEIKGRLRQISPNALSDAEKLALKAALAVLGTIDLEGLVKKEVKAGFSSAKDGLLALLDQVVAALDTIRNRFNQYSPETLLRTVTSVIDRAEAAITGLDARMLLRPLDAGIDEIGRQLAAHSPAQLLTPLQAPYGAVMTAVSRLDPDQLVAPLNGIYGEVDKLIGRVDLTPLLDELDRRQRQLFTDIRGALLAALDALALPEPLAGFFRQVRPVIEAMGDALLQNPDSELKRIAVDLRQKLKPSDLFRPLDAAFDRLLAALRAIPQTDLVGALETLRSTIGRGVDLFDPRRLMGLLRDARTAAAEMSPASLLALPPGLPAARAAFAARTAAAPAAMQPAMTAILQHFDRLGTFLAGTGADSAGPRLQAAHAGLIAAFDARLAALDPTAATLAHDALRARLAAIIPAFLRSAEPLTPAAVMAGLESLRPSQQTAAVDRAFDRFVAALGPIETALEPAINDFFAGLRDAARLISPLVVKDGVAAIYDAVRAKVRILDPKDLAAGLKTAAFEPALQALQAIDPAALQTRLQVSFAKAVQAVTATLSGILNDVGAALTEQLAAIKAAVTTLAGEVKTTIANAVKSFSDLVEDLESLVFVDVLGRLRQIIETLAVSFDRELDRVISAFNAMLQAIPLGGRSPVTVDVST
jgi:hypothetical protein